MKYAVFFEGFPKIVLLSYTVLSVLSVTHFLVGEQKSQLFVSVFAQFLPSCNLQNGFNHHSMVNGRRTNSVEFTNVR